ncbi:hypothetical protein A2619_05635 [candidate division WWE3 bacterium RIFOXYD1_FULL_39_9]|nr:MAG: hypothetical protein A2619_05635 [candidate division WWE3 bacterium RIFOXYD1_FULL_39_9]
MEGILGAGLACIWKPLSFDPVVPSIHFAGQFVSKTGECGGEDTFTNHAAMVMQMFGQMLRTQTDSGATALRGENEQVGGIAQRFGNYIGFTAFHGGTEDQNIRLATLGMILIEYTANSSGYEWNIFLRIKGNMPKTFSTVYPRGVSYNTELVTKATHLSDGQSMIEGVFIGRYPKGWLTIGRGHTLTVVPVEKWQEVKPTGLQEEKIVDPILVI